LEVIVLILDIVKKTPQHYVVRMHLSTTTFRKSSIIGIAQKSYVIITKEGINFVRKRYFCSTVLDSEEIELYEFLIQLLSLGGILPLDLIRKWRKKEILEKAQKNHYVTITLLRQELPKNEVQDAIEEIWGKIPKGIYV
jgi:hypothetical protein